MQCWMSLAIYTMRRVEVIPYKAEHAIELMKNPNELGLNCYPEEVRAEVYAALDAGVQIIVEKQ